MPLQACFIEPTLWAMKLELAGLKDEELHLLEWTTRHMEPDGQRSHAAYEFGFALKAEIRARMRFTITGESGQNPVQDVR